MTNRYQSGLVPETDRNKLAHAIPLRDRVLVRKDKTGNKTAGGILIPDVAKVVPLDGVVVAMGPGKRDERGTLHPIDGLKIGDRVLFTRYAGAPMGDELDPDNRSDAFDYTIVGADEIVAVLSQERPNGKAKPG